ncbi:MAG: hypothetical protein U5R30_06780 [Deltaproteobacteria bacterium]|nr:hypothetical protein [Deltaproteobacteria bacterium]
MRNIGGGFILGQRLEAVVDGDAFPYRPVRRLQQFLIELVLSDQENVQRLGVPAFHVRQKANLFQNPIAGDLTFIDDEQGFFVMGTHVLQKFADGIAEGLLVTHRPVDTEFARDQVKKLLSPQAGVGQSGDHNVFVTQSIDQGADQGRFAGTDVPGQKQQAFVLYHTVLQGGERFRVVSAKPQKAGIGVQLEWLLLQFKMGAIHDRLLF